MRTDSAYNVIGLLPSGTPGARLVAMGSHLDTVPQGGKFDGMLGVLAALECVRTIREQGIALPWNLEIINFTDEEAAHNAGTVGSRAMMGLLSDRELTRMSGRGWPTSPKTYAGRERPGADRRGAARSRGVLHLLCGDPIEQGRDWKHQGIQIGAVTAIVGIYRYLVTVEGEAAHAGTTPMALRNDALVNAAPLFTLLPEWVQDARPRDGRDRRADRLSPARPMWSPPLPIRGRGPLAADQADMIHLREVLREYAADREGWHVETIFEKNGTPCAERLIQAVEDAAAPRGSRAYGCQAAPGTTRKAWPPPAFP